MLAEMFKQVAGMKEGEGSPVPPRRVKKQLSSTDLSKEENVAALLCVILIPHRYSAQEDLSCNP